MSDATAIVFEGLPRTLSFGQFPIPPLRAGEWLVRVLGSTLCGSDLHTYSGRRAVAVPTILGHEIVGEILDFGPDHPRRDWSGAALAVGDRVTWAVVAACGSCFACTHDLWPKCTSATKYGHERLAAGRELLGGLASHVVLVEHTAVVKVPEGLPLEVACPANCATATVAAALEAAGDLSGAVVGILGCGLLGLTTCAMARARGAKATIAVDLSTERRERARSFGATDTVSAEEFTAAAREATDGRGIDVLIELTGSTPALQTAWPLIRVGGTLVLVGAVFPDRPFEIEPEQLVRRHLTIRGVHNYSPRHLVEAIRFLNETHNMYPFVQLVSDWLPLADSSRAFELAEDPGRIRVGIRNTV